MDFSAFFRGLRLRRWITPLLILLAWQAASSLNVIPPRTLPSPVTVAQSFVALTASGELPHNLLVSLGRVAAGLGLAILCGTTLALIAGLSRRGEDLLDAPLQMLRTLPFLALVPLFILWFGIGETPKIILIALGATFPIYLTLFAGIRGVERKLIEMGQTLGLTRREQIWEVIIPGALPSALVGLRYSLGVSWLSLVVAEQINANAGLGYLINSARDFLQTDVIVVCLVVYAMLGLGADQLVRGIERLTLAWRPNFVGS
jgi:sulfonate transport system permease protein